MKHGRLFSMAPMVWVLCAALLILSGVTWFFNDITAYIELGISVFLIILCIVRSFSQQRLIDRYLRRTLRHIDEEDKQSLSQSPLPILLVAKNGQILWHNTIFQTRVTDGHSYQGHAAEELLPENILSSLNTTTTFECDVLEHHYMVFISPLTARDLEMYVLYYLDVTQLHIAAEEYAATRPIVMLINIDNMEELMQRLRDSERAGIAAKVENALEDWLSETTAILQKYDDERFMAIIEKRFVQAMIDARFDILDRVRAIPMDNNTQITLSIGIGEGVHFQQAEGMARQAIDMALGRGGDQVALRTKNGFEFYGGLSKGVEKRTKVRTRVMASALQDLIHSSDNVLIMGHRFSDLDSVGSGLALASAARALGKQAHYVVSKKNTLAKELLERFEQNGRGDLFIDPTDAAILVRPRTLLIVTDTQNPLLLEAPSLYEQISTVAVIDHHRKMIDHIEKTVLFYHESYASSACEMVAEMVQYLDIPAISALEAEALLSGIMLDTRNFVLKAGVRTFEAAAFLRKQGADTVSVKKIFSGSMDMYKKKAEIVSDVLFYKNTAIACAKKHGNSAELRIACSQAADEMLSIKETHAAFTLFDDSGAINISARSYGDYNVQLIAEYLGGGGHLTMAGAQLKDTTMQDAVEQLKRAIDRYIDANLRAAT